ncbi:hypothetical protein J6590_030056 [Homalodisca vitripennis]|nr:hypothetical protein J6590_030056 [Homalodisca vitripennis]
MELDQYRGYQYRRRCVKVKMDDQGNILVKRVSKCNVYVKNTSARLDTSIGGDGVKVKMDDQGNILVKRVSKCNVYVKNTSAGEDTSIGGDVLKLPNCSLEPEKPVKLFDMKKFQANVSREMRRAYPDRKTLESQCLSALAFVKSEAELLDCPIWVLIINVVAMDMLKSKFPPKGMFYDGQWKRGGLLRREVKAELYVLIMKRISFPVWTRVPEDITFDYCYARTMNSQMNRIDPMSDRGRPSEDVQSAAAEEQNLDLGRHNADTPINPSSATKDFISRNKTLDFTLDTVISPGGGLAAPALCPIVPIVWSVSSIEHIDPTSSLFVFVLDKRKQLGLDLNTQGFVQLAQFHRFYRL